MKYVISYYTCKCGERVSFRIDALKLSQFIGSTLTEICPYCDRKHKFTTSDRTPVMCRKDQNAPAVFDTKDEEIYQNATPN